MRHALQYENPAEKVQSVYHSHDGQNFARETIIDSEYNVRLLVDFLQEPSVDSEVELDWHVTVKIEAIDPDRSVKVVPFLYLRKDQSLEAVPYGITLDKQEEENKVSIHGVKVL